MSMLSAQRDRLRDMADMYPELPIIQRELRSAADTIWDLRNKCVDLRDENESLRELCRDMYEQMLCVFEPDEVEQFRVEMERIGIEVDA